VSMDTIEGRRHSFRCPSCRKVFFAWRPDRLPGVRVKCYFCKTDFDDEASRRAPPPAKAAEAAAPTPA